MIEKLKAAGNWVLIVLGILAAVLFGANTLKKRSRASNTKDEPPAGKGPLVEQQAKEVEVVNEKVEDVNQSAASPPPKTNADDTDMDDLVKRYDRL